MCFTRQREILEGPISLAHWNMNMPLSLAVTMSKQENSSRASSLLSQPKPCCCHLVCTFVSVHSELISLYAHVSGLAFDFNTFDAPVTHVTLSDKRDGELRSMTLDRSRPAFELANMLWDNMDTPQLQQ